jgi:aminoglycoside phosphotransferase (APT) family kinase protein
VHAVDGQAAETAGCEQAGIPAPGASRGPHHYYEARTSLERLVGSRPDLPGLRALAELVEDARPRYERAPLALCQYDVHLCQFVLARRGSEWECTAILDWESVDLDDPDWDLAQMDGFRFEEVGPTPPAFFAAYGREPRGLYPLYRIERAAWILDAFARGEGWLALSAPPAEAYLRKVVAELG